MKSLGFSRALLTRPILKSLLALSIVTVAAGCDDDLAPFEPEITNATDNFQLQATGVSRVTTTKTYTWTITGTQATVNHSTTTTNGSANLIIKDADGTVVYDKALVPSLNETTDVGVAGDWTIELKLTNYSGTLNFRVQKTT